MLGFGRTASIKSCRFSTFLLWLQSVQIPPHLRWQRYNKKLKTESGKRKTFVFRFSLGVGKRNRRCGASAEWACTLCRAARRKSLRSRIKADNGKLLFFGFRLELENGTLRLSRAQRTNLFAPCRGKAAKRPREKVFTPSRYQIVATPQRMSQ